MIPCTLHLRPVVQTLASRQSLPSHHCRKEGQLITTAKTAFQVLLGLKLIPPPAASVFPAGKIFTSHYEDNTHETCYKHRVRLTHSHGNAVCQQPHQRLLLQDATREVQVGRLSPLPPTCIRSERHKFLVCHSHSCSRPPFAVLHFPGLR